MMNSDKITCPHCGTEQAPFEEWGEILCRSCDKHIGFVDPRICAHRVIGIGSDKIRRCHTCGTVIGDV